MHGLRWPKIGGRRSQCFCTILPFPGKRRKRGGRYLLAILGAEARGKHHEESNAPGLEKFAMHAMRSAVRRKHIDVVYSFSSFFFLLTIYVLRLLLYLLYVTIFLTLDGIFLRVWFLRPSHLTTLRRSWMSWELRRTTLRRFSFLTGKSNFNAIKLYLRR